MIRVLHADEALIVIHKPAGLLSVPGRGADKQDCASQWVQSHYPDALVVHRLDMATSGLLAFARGLPAQRTLNAAFAQRQVHKRYEAIVHGLLLPPNFPDSPKAPDAPNALDAPNASPWATIDLPIALDWPQRPLRIIAPHGKPSTTRWRVLASLSSSDGAARTRLQLEPLTGRSHQLRVHLQALGHPIVGDALYAPPPIATAAPRLLLHASELGLHHPHSGAWMHFHCPAEF